MKKKIVFAVILLLLIPCSIASASKKQDNPYGDPFKIRTTCYLPTGNKTASGTVPKMFRTIAGRKEDIGKTCIVYSINDDGSIGHVIFIGEIEDTGGPFIRSGQRIDIFVNTMEDAENWIDIYGDYTMIQIIEGEG